MVNTNIEKRSRTILGVMGLLLIVAYIGLTFGSSQTVMFALALGGISIGLILYSEAGVVAYFRESKWKSIGFGDVMVIASVFVGTVLIINSILFFPAINSLVSQGFLDTIQGTAATFAILGAILLIVNIFSARFS